MAVYIFMVLFLYSCSWLDFKANRKIGYILFTFIFSCLYYMMAFGGRRERIGKLLSVLFKLLMG